MQFVKIAWLAGVIDGEGSFTIFNRKNKSKNGNFIVTPTANITITNSNKALIDECEQILKNIGVKYSLKNPRNSTTRTLERLDIRNYKSIMILINILLPYLVGKKDQAILMKEFVKKALFRIHFSNSTERREFLVRMSKLNKLGQVIRRDYTPGPHPK
ncbi:hypothetical protein A2154_02210 [Candidatus Gottesmanbacteria bacterium RBG_16_43_7]|uniref:Homing endonuclease LAGLIDADG domain-containing protein n=1 Tax=Candidatus Gottesmanbacteria bacterium RBG_16_43_7 TaxID=1798373 RepID=A0A1F5Z917_9BACT|nr:MAG: hypothetical protein A2154_02210 [Candidatus Gottesmanbacteria bacterium RBG_16_43_7]